MFVHVCGLCCDMFVHVCGLCCDMFVHVCGLCCDMFVHVCGFLLGRKSTYSLERKKAQSDVRIGGT